MKVARTVREGLVGKEPSGDTTCHETGRSTEPNGISLASYFIQFRLLMLHVSFPLLQGTPRLFQAFGTRQKSLHLQLQFDALPPEEFAPLHLRMAGLSVILVLVMTALVVLVMSLIAMGVLLIGHEKPFFAGAGCSVHRERNEQHENRQNQPLMVLLN